MLSRLKRERHLIDNAATTTAERRFLSPTFYAQDTQVLAAILKHARGRLVDLGCGTSPFFAQISDTITLYVGLDVVARSEGRQIVGSIEKMDMIGSQRFDSALCIEVLEHLPHPWRAVAEIYRILKPGGTIILSVPHLSRLHEEPHDYFRYTHYGLRSLFEDAGFEIVTLEPRGGLFSFLGHQLSSLIITLFWSTRFRAQALWLNKWGVTLPSVWIDRFFPVGGLFAHGYLLVARKPPDG